MSTSHWILYVISTLIALAAILYLYRRREPAGRGRTVLAMLRWAALAILLLLLFDPRLARPLSRSPADRAPVLVDGSLSMLLPGADDGSRWQAALAEARTRAGNGPVVLFGDVPATLTGDSLARHAPAATASRLLPALQAAAEAGAPRVTVITDGAIGDADAVTRWLPRLGVGVDWVAVPSSAPNVAMTGLGAPEWVEAGAPMDLRIGVQRSGVRRARDDSAAVVVRQDGRVIATQRIAVPAEDRISEMVMRVQPIPPAGGGYVHLEATLEAGDPFSDDNVRHAYVHISTEPAGIVLVSMAPDWEPRFLLPVLERAVGLPARGYLRMPDGTWLRAAGGLEAGRRVTDPEVRRAVEAADLLVIHNITATSPAWLASAMTDTRRLLVLPATEVAGIELPVPIGRGQEDDWFVSADVPSSPVAPLLSGMRVEDAPPLDALHTASSPPGAWTPLVATRGRGGGPSPLAIAGERAGQRWAVALAAGYWRWAFRGGASADVYNRLWSSLGGWLVQDARSADIAAIRPVERVTPRGAPLRFVARSGSLDSMRLRLAGGDGAAPLDTIVHADRDTAALGARVPGTYRYSVTGYTGGDAVAAAGELTVETYSPEFARPDAQLPEAGGEALRALRDGRDTTPLHASVLPYALLLLLLSGEWILRRRWGLR